MTILCPPLHVRSAVDAYLRRVGNLDLISGRSDAALIPSKPNGRDSDGRPSGAELLRDAALSLDSIRKEQTDETTPTDADSVGTGTLFLSRSRNALHRAQRTDDVLPPLRMAKQWTGTRYNPRPYVVDARTPAVAVESADQVTAHGLLIEQEVRR